MFGPYRIEELLGRGGMGEVYLAHDTQTERTVALKVMPAHLAEDAEYQERFRRECAAAASLNEPHIVPIHRFGDVDGRLFLDMRLVRGTDLGAWLKTYGPMPPEVAVAVITQVAQALDAAHVDGLVHRDVKPSNVLLAGVTGPDVDAAQVFAYLLDFGIARSRDDAPLTAVGQIVGTHRYMAPERFEGAEGDPAADVYALACVLHQALTGSPPFPGRLADVMTAHLRQPPPQPSKLRPGVPAGLDDVVATGMAKAPDDRYPTAGELARAARAAIGANSGYFPVTTVADPTGDRTARVQPVAAPEPSPRREPPPSAPTPPPPPRYEPVRDRVAPRAEQAAAAVARTPARPRRRAPRAWLAGLAIVVFAVVAAGSGLVLSRLGYFAGNPALSQQQQPPRQPTEDELFLDSLPTGFGRANCGLRPEERSTSGALAYLACQNGPADGATSAQFARFATREQLDREFERLAARLSPGQRGSAPACRSGDTVRSRWTRTGLGGGSIACAVGTDVRSAQAAFLLWTDTDALAVGYVRRDDSNAAVLYDWWAGTRIKPRS